GGELLLDSIAVEIKKGPLREKQLLPIAVAAWCEAFGQSAPSEQDAAAARDAAREGFIKLLRKGKKGVEEWNADVGRLTKAGNFKNVDLSDLNLTNINFDSLDFEQANFAMSTLSSAQCDSACFRGACFSKARLSDAHFVRSDFTEADFSGADLTHASLGQRTGYRPCACPLQK